MNRPNLKTRHRPVGGFFHSRKMVELIVVKCDMESGDKLTSR